jgi:hypothetical protein
MRELTVGVVETAKYRYTGQDGDHTHNILIDPKKPELGSKAFVLEPGDVVELRPDQAMAFRDRFTAVDDKGVPLTQPIEREEGLQYDLTPENTPANMTNVYTDEATAIRRSLETGKPVKGAGQVTADAAKAIADNADTAAQQPVRTPVTPVKPGEGSGVGATKPQSTTTGST